MTVRQQQRVISLYTYTPVVQFMRWHFGAKLKAKIKQKQIQNVIAEVQ